MHMEMFMRYTWTFQGWLSHIQYVLSFGRGCDVLFILVGATFSDSYNCSADQAGDVNAVKKGLAVCGTALDLCEVNKYM